MPGFEKPFMDSQSELTHWAPLGLLEFSVREVLLSSVQRYALVVLSVVAADMTGLVVRLPTITLHTFEPPSLVHSAPMLARCSLASKCPIASEAVKSPLNYPVTPSRRHWQSIPFSKSLRTELEQCAVIIRN